jgi:hypothetical protein
VQALLPQLTPDQATGLQTLLQPPAEGVTMQGIPSAGAAASIECAPAQRFVELLWAPTHPVAPVVLIFESASGQQLRLPITTPARRAMETALARLHQQEAEAAVPPERPDLAS